MAELTPRLEREKTYWERTGTKRKLSKSGPPISIILPVVGTDFRSLGISFYGSLTAFATVFWL